jgi:hypothetical protein
MQATTDTWAAKLVRGLVKTIFVGCYVAFMWASIHHVAAFFNDFEADTGNTWGSYLLAGAFDITALVTTMGVMFFRKSMPGWVFWIVWAFILAIAGYSFFINWEYASHYQNLALLLQPTGATTAVYDTHGALHYVPVRVRIREETPDKRWIKSRQCIRKAQVETRHKKQGERWVKQPQRILLQLALVALRASQ